MVGTTGPGPQDFLATDEGKAALRTLTAAERVTCTWLIARQFHYRRSIRLELYKYGPEGTVKLSSARAMYAFMLPLAPVLIALGFIGEGVAAVLVWLAMLAILLFGYSRMVSANRAGRRWRDGQRSAAEH